MAGFSIADFFAQLSIKADTKEVKKIEDSLNRINKSLKMIGAESVAQAKKVDTIFKDEALKRNRLAIQAAHDRLERMGSSLVGFKERLNSINKQSEFLKIKNEITEATIASQRFKNELKLLHNTNTLYGKENVFKKPDAFNSTKGGDNKALTPFKGGDHFFDKTIQGRKLLFSLTKDQQRALKDEAKALERLNKTSIDANLILKDRAASYRKLNRTLETTKQKTTELTRAQNRLKESARQLAISSLGAFAIFDGVKSISRVGQDFEGMEASMLASAGSAVLAAKDLQFVDEQVVRLGLDLRATTDAYSKLQFAAKDKMSREQTRELFVGFSEFATALKVNPEQQKAGLRAIQQMLNKGQVMAEELKSQLAEQVAGSIQIFSNALGVSEKELFKMMEKGELLASEVLPKVSKEFAKAARNGGALSKALKTVRVQQGKVVTDIQKSQNTIFKAGFGQGYADFLKTVSEILKDLQPTLKVVGALFRFAFNVISSSLSMLTAPIKVLGDLVEGFVDLNNIWDETTDQVTSKLISMSLLLLTPWGRVLALFIGIKGILEEIIALTTENVIGQIERDLGRDIGFDFGVGKKAGQTSKQITKNPNNAFVMNPIAGAADLYKDLISGAPLRSLLSMTLDNAGKPINVDVINNISADEFGNTKVENIISKSIVNGQAQR